MNKYFILKGITYNKVINKNNNTKFLFVTNISI